MEPRYRYGSQLTAAAKLRLFISSLESIILYSPRKVQVGSPERCGLIRCQQMNVAKPPRTASGPTSAPTDSRPGQPAPIAEVVLEPSPPRPPRPPRAWLAHSPGHRMNASTFIIASRIFAEFNGCASKAFAEHHSGWKSHPVFDSQDQLTIMPWLSDPKLLGWPPSQPRPGWGQRSHHAGNSGAPSDDPA